MQVQTVVVGAGVVGLACARELAHGGDEVVVLEEAPAIGTGISSRHSEVIHAGIYYPPGSLKARLCVDGKQRLYAFLASRGLGHRRIGKLVVATDTAQHGALEAIAARAEACGVHDLRWLDGHDARALEPELSCTSALWSPSTGILDSHAVMAQLHAEAEASGAAFAFRAPVVGGSCAPLRVRVGGEAPMTLRCERLVVAAGLASGRVAASLGLPEVPVYLARGSYFALRGRSPFSHLIYPVPEPGGLGVHLTLDLAGQARFGPDVEWVEREDYAVDPRRAAMFAGRVRTWWPGLSDDGLMPAYAGIRPKLDPDGVWADFRVDDATVHGVEGLVCLHGIESPGFTSALALAAWVADRLTTA